VLWDLILEQPFKLRFYFCSCDVLMKSIVAVSGIRRANDSINRSFVGSAWYQLNMPVDVAASLELCDLNWCCVRRRSSVKQLNSQSETKRGPRLPRGRRQRPTMNILSSVKDTNTPCCLWAHTYVINVCISRTVSLCIHVWTEDNEVGRHAWEKSEIHIKISRKMLKEFGRLGIDGRVIWWICRLVVVMGWDFVSALRPVACCTIPGWKRMWLSERARSARANS
jgi:hypothetical protein